MQALHLLAGLGVWGWIALGVLLFLLGVAMGVGKAAVYKHIPEYFYREFVPKDDVPPFTLLPSFTAPVEPPADAGQPSTPNWPSTPNY